MANGLAEKIRKQKERKNSSQSQNGSTGEPKTKKRRRKIKKSYYSSESEDTDDLIEKISFVDQPGEIEGKLDKTETRQEKITRYFPRL